MEVPVQALVGVEREWTQIEEALRSALNLLGEVPVGAFSVPVRSSVAEAIGAITAATKSQQEAIGQVSVALRDWRHDVIQVDQGVSQQLCRIRS